MTNKKGIFYAMVALLLSAVLIGCSDSKSTDKEDDVGEDLLNYVNNNLIEFEEKTVKINEIYSSVSGENYTDDLTMYNTIQDEIIQDYLLFIEDLESVKTETREVRDLHEMLILAHNTQYNALVKILAALERGDYNLIAEANQLLDKAREVYRDFQFEIQNLGDEYDVQVEIWDD